jgi:protein TonB
MEPKKNPKYDVHAQRSVIFNISLALSLLIVIAAFRWRTVITEQNASWETKAPESDVITVIPRTTHRSSDQDPKPKMMKATVSLPVNFTSSPSTDSDHHDSPFIESSDTTSIDLGTVVEPEDEVADDIITTAEKMPEPVNGYEGFYTMLGEHLKYPTRARRNHTQGKVFVEFVVNKEGAIENMKVLKGIGDGCDEEAMRVLSLSKWKAGKQRGKPVKVKLVQVISFYLQ